MLKQRHISTFKQRWNEVVFKRWDNLRISTSKQCCFLVEMTFQHWNNVEVRLKYRRCFNVEATSVLQHWNSVENLTLFQCWNISTATLKFGLKTWQYFNGESMLSTPQPDFNQISTKFQPSLLSEMAVVCRLQYFTRCFDTGISWDRGIRHPHECQCDIQLHWKNNNTLRSI